MLPEQADILWTFVTIIFTLFSMFAFINVIQHCRAKEGTNTVLWGTVFGAGFIINLLLTNHMFKILGAPFSCEYLVIHRAISSLRLKEDRTLIYTIAKVNMLRKEGINGWPLISHTSAPESIATAASFRT